jgi:hypothetical protein
MTVLAGRAVLIKNIYLRLHWISHQTRPESPTI